jgi:hypothetical protein
VERFSSAIFKLASERLHRIALAGDVEREPARRREAIQSAAASIARRGHVILPLIEEDAGFLAVQKIGVQPQAIHFHLDDFGNLTGQYSGLKRQCFALAHGYVVALDHSFESE